MEKTTNYQLNQWDANDKVQRVDFNADNAKIDAALAAVASAKADKTALAALQTAFDAAKATIPKIAVGTYTGNSAESQTVSLGFTPKALLSMKQDGSTHEPNTIWGGLALSGSPVAATSGAGGLTAVQIVSGGFRVFTKSSNYTSARANDNGTVYCYLAIG